MLTLLAIDKTAMVGKNSKGMSGFWGDSRLDEFFWRRYSSFSKRRRTKPVHHVTLLHKQISKGTSFDFLGDCSLYVSIRQSSSPAANKNAGIMYQKIRAVLRYRYTTRGKFMIRGHNALNIDTANNAVDSLLMRYWNVCLLFTTKRHCAILKGCWYYTNANP